MLRLDRSFHCEPYVVHFREATHRGSQPKHHSTAGQQVGQAGMYAAIIRKTASYDFEPTAHSLHSAHLLLGNVHTDMGCGRGISLTSQRLTFGEGDPSGRGCLGGRGDLTGVGDPSGGSDPSGGAGSSERMGNPSGGGGTIGGCDLCGRGGLRGRRSLS